MSRGTWLRIIVTLAVLAWLCYRINWTELRTTVSGMNVALGLAALAIATVVQVGNGTRWWLLARPLGFNDGWFRFVQLYLVGLYFNLFMPSVVGGDVIRSWYLDGNRGKRPLALVSVFVEQSSNMLMLLVLAVIASVASWDSLPPWMPMVVLIVCGGGIVGAALLIWIAPVANRWLAGTPSRIGRFLREYVRTFAEAVAIYRERRTLFFGSLVAALANHSLNITGCWLTAQALGIDVSLGYMMIVIPLLATLLLVPISISGIGVRETSLSMFLAPKGIAESASVGLGLMTFFNFALVGLSGGVIYTFGRFPKLSFQSQAPAPDAALAPIGRSAADANVVR